MKIQTEQFGEVHVLTNCPLIDSTEALEFRTEVNEATDGTEYRNCLRDTPRQILNFNYLAMRKAVGDMFHLLSANLRKIWGIPLTHLRQSIPDLIDDDFIPLSVNTIDLKIGYALIKSASFTQVVEIVNIGRYVVTQQEERDPETNEIIHPEIVEYQDGLRLLEAMTVSNATIEPLRICIIDGGVGLNVGGFWSGVNLSFLVLSEDGPAFQEDVPAQYKDFDFYSKPLLLDGDSLEMSLTQHQAIVDGSIGGFTQFTDHQKPRYSKPFKAILRDRGEFIAYRKFLMRRLGRYRPFWLPLYEKHINVVSTGLITNLLDVDTEYVIEVDRKYLAVKITDQWQAHEITSKVKIGNLTRLTISPTLNAQVSTIQGICYLGLHRLDSDRIEFQFAGNDKVQVTVPIIEL